MTRLGARVGVLTALCCAAALIQAAPSHAGVDAGDRFVVVYQDRVAVGAATAERERRLGFDADYRYRSALEGFAAELTPAQVASLEADPAVAFLSPDRQFEAAANVALASGEETPPTGVRRIGAASTSSSRQQSEADVAVIDSGIQLDHPDLNVADGTDCIDPATPAADGTGHGTHVAGTIGARNNGAGVVGVAPATKVHAVRVLGNSGTGTTAQVVCGVDWVTANAAALGIEVATMSLTGPGAPVQSCATTTDVLHLAICNSTAAGVSYVVAAGNDAEYFDVASNPVIPAAYPQVLTVTALSDSNGVGGGGGGAPACRPSEGDDVAAATFSNVAGTAGGEAHTIAGPGVCIRSTSTGSGYTTRSGTSMAVPHVAGLAALCVDEAGAAGSCASDTPEQLITRVRAAAEAHATALPDSGFTGDPLHSPTPAIYYGFMAPASLIDAGAPDTSISSGPPPQTADPTPSFEFTASELGASFECKIDSAAYTPCSGPGASHTTAPLADGGHTLSVRARDPAGNVDATPASATFQVDATAPATAITSGPLELVRTREVTFTFSADEASASYQCSLDGAPFGACSGPGAADTITGLSDGLHTFAVRASDQLGNLEDTPATRSFAVDTVAPVTTILEGPASLTNEAIARFRFSASESAVHFDCDLDGGGFSPCSSGDGLEAGPLQDGQHELRVRGVDSAGNVESEPVSYRFDVDTTAPDATVVTPRRVVTDRRAARVRLRLASSEPSSFACRVDRGPWVACESGDKVRLVAKPRGVRHQLQVRAIDDAGNVDPRPARAAVTVTRRS